MRTEHRNWLVVAAITALFVVVGMRAFGTGTLAQEKAVAPPQLIWRPIKAAGTPRSMTVYRAEVPNGWLVLVSEYRERGRGNSNTDGYGFGVGTGAGVTFVPDPQHTWRVR